MATSATIHNLIMRRALMALAAMAASLLLVLGTAALPAQAQSTPSGTTITVNTNVDEDNTDGDCSLREAIKAANTNLGVDACPAGSSSGEDTIGFTLDSSTDTITLSSRLPALADAAGLAIDGGAQANVTVSGNYAVRVFWVGPLAKVTLRNLTVAHGKESTGAFAGVGAGIYNRGTLTVTDSTFFKNSASRGVGGAIHNEGTLTVTDSTFSNNSTTDRGGAINNHRGSTLKVANSTFSHNSAYEGGAIYKDGGKIEVTNSTFSYNSADLQGGAIRNDGYYDGSLVLEVTNSTFFKNSARWGSSIQNGGWAQTKLTNTILSNSSGGQNCEGANIVDGGYNMEDTNTCGFATANNSKPNTNPKLDPEGLMDNGGPTKTIALLADSPAINAIPQGTNGCPTSGATDQRGLTRPQGDACEVGAFEIREPNQLPVAQDDQFSTDEDTPSDLDVLANDSDPDAEDTLTFTALSAPAHGQVTSNSSDGTITYTPDKDYNGADSFTYTLRDGNNGTDTATVTLTVSAVNDAPSFELPVAPDQTVNEDAGAQSVRSFATKISAGPSDEATQKVSFTLQNDNTSLFSSQPQISSAGTLTYTPAPDANGTATVKVKATDDGGTTNGGKDTSTEQSFTITVEATNDAPEATNESYSVDEDKILSVPDGTTDHLLANDSDIEGDSLTAVQEVGPAHGQLALSPDGSFTYTPDKDYYGVDSFTYKASDGTAYSNVATVTITVNAVNDEPVGTTDAKETPENTPLVLTQAQLTNNDNAGAPNESGQTLTITEVSDPQHGEVSLDKDKAEITFTPEAGYNGKEASFLYTLCDNGQPQACSVEKVIVNVTVTEVNDPPVASADSISVAEDGEQIFDPTSNDSTGPANEATQILTVDSIASQAQHGSATLITSGADAGKVSYKPNADYFGSDSFTYKVCDDGTTKGELDAKCDVGTVSVSVNPVNDNPVAKADTKSTPENTPLVLSFSDLTNNDEVGASNEEGQTLTITEVNNPTHGTVKLENGQIIFTPAANYNGPASFLYTVCDNGEPEPKCSTQSATVSVTVSPINSRPQATERSFTINEDAAPLTIDFSRLVSDVETADANLTYNVASVKPSQGTLSGTAHSRTFTSADDFNGTVTISYTVTDRGDPDNCATTGGGGGACADALESEQKTVSITVRATNDAPLAKSDSYRLKEDSKLYVPPLSGVLKNDSDVDGDKLSASLASGPRHGRLTLRANGSFVYAPDKDYAGADSFSYRASDGTARSNLATVKLVVRAASEPDPGGCTIVGTPAKDEIEGTARADVICALGGNDAISGLGGNDTIYGDAGIDAIAGGAGDDRMYGGGGSDALEAKDGSGGDLADGGTGTDACSADRGDTKRNCP